MTVECGFGGQKFQEQVLHKVRGVACHRHWCVASHCTNMAALQGFKLLVAPASGMRKLPEISS
jgi:hypothetical protein